MTMRASAINAKARAVKDGRKTYKGKPCSHHPDVQEKWTSNGNCIQCTKEGRKLYIERNKESLVIKRREWDHNNPVKAMLQRARRRAKDFGLLFSLKEEDVVIPSLCPVLGIKLMRGDAADCAPSLDRINNELGYVPGNVVVVSFRANRIKGNATIDELQKVVKFYEQHFC